MSFHMPAGMPGSISWKAEQIGISPYQLAMAAAGEPGKTGNQARFYMAMTMHQRLRGMARVAAQNPTPPTA